MADLTGSTIDKYELVRCIGKGGMGAVYEARHTLVHKRCALKVLHGELAENEEAVRRMLREAQAAAAIGHPNIVETHDFGATADSMHYLVMEYLEGLSLGQLVEKREGRLEVDLAASVLYQVLLALEAAHEKGIVHRDLKPDNIFIAKAPRGGYEVKLLDFGISKMSATSEGSVGITRTGALLGTPYYMSPEQAQGAERVDSRSDLWAVGVILHEVLTGERPFEGNNYNQVILKIVMEDSARPRDIAPWIPEALEAVILKAMQRARGDRYQTAAEMSAALRPFCDPEVARTGLLDLDLSAELPAVDPGSATVSYDDVRSSSRSPSRRTDATVGEGAEAGSAPEAGADSGTALAPRAGADARTSHGWPPPAEVLGRESVMGEPQRAERTRRKWILAGGLAAALALVAVLLYSLAGRGGHSDDRHPAAGAKHGTPPADARPADARPGPDAAPAPSPAPDAAAPVTAPDTMRASPRQASRPRHRRTAPRRIAPRRTTPVMRRVMRRATHPVMHPVHRRRARPTMTTHKGLFTDPYGND